ncbi:MAG: DUF5343 domain-containing protein [Pseudomonadota bacterium]|nr:DUF5343 domain-containing protein [Pseudomonadota bacterium]
MKNGGLPRRIETRVFANKLEGEASRVVAGFNALGWIDEAGRPTEDLRRLVSAFGTEELGSVLAEVLPRAYPYLQELDLESTTNNALREAFVSYIGREPETLRNAETFFLCLATEAGRPMSEHFSRRASRGVGDAKRWFRVAETGVLEEKVTKPVGLDDPPKTNANSSEGIGSLASKIVELTALLGEGDMTDEEKTAVVTLLSYLGRRLKR